jgi:hypothetical protein
MIYAITYLNPGRRGASFRMFHRSLLYKKNSDVPSRPFTRRNPPYISRIYSDLRSCVCLFCARVEEKARRKEHPCFIIMARISETPFSASARFMYKNNELHFGRPVLYTLLPMARFCLLWLVGNGFGRVSKWSCL